jgi:phosphatidylinositol glycan class V
MQTTFGHALEKTPRTLLVILFLAWKLLLLTIVLLVPGPGYDTSAQLLFQGFGVGEVPFSGPPSVGHGASHSWAFRFERLVENLTRWDAIYFVPLAERGYKLEQEWAFGWGFTRLLSFLSKSMLILPSCSKYPLHSDIKPLGWNILHCFF